MSNERIEQSSPTEHKAMLQGMARSLPQFSVGGQLALDVGPAVTVADKSTFVGEPWGVHDNERTSQWSHVMALSGTTLAAGQIQRIAKVDLRLPENAAQFRLA